MEKAALIGLVTLRYIECDENFSMRGEKLLKVIKQDRDKGLIPFWVSNEIIFYTRIFKSDRIKIESLLRNALNL